MPHVAAAERFYIRLQIAFFGEKIPGRRAILSGAMNGTPHLLIVDDDSEICTLLSGFLVQYGFRVSVATNGGAMMQSLASAKIDLVVLDIMLPGKDGLALCRELRAGGRVPIIMLTAIGGEADRVLGLEIGADDYLTKPFSPRELVARIRAVLRRAAGSGSGAPPGADKVYEFAGWRLDVTRRQLFSPAGALVMLRTAEFDILLALVERPQRTLTRDQLLDLARGRASSPFDRAIDVHFSRLR